MAIRKLGHVGIWAKDFDQVRDFYSNVLGLHISDQTANAAFMTSDPEREHHEFVVFRATQPGQHTSVQQVSFSCEKLEDVIDYYRRFKENNVKFSRITSHGNAVGLYFYDPEDNHIEVYWTTPFQARQPYGVAIDINRPVDEILRDIEADVKIHGATGHRDPESFVKQREQFQREGIRC
ncbi:MAG: VOC family protein [Burkholderiales bacterium]